MFYTKQMRFNTTYTTWNRVFVLFPENLLTQLLKDKPICRNRLHFLTLHISNTAITSTNASNDTRPSEWTALT